MKSEAFDLNIERSDNRVSYKILTVTIIVSTNEISVEHKTNKTAEFQDKYKIEFDDICGLNLIEEHCLVEIACKGLTHTTN